MPNLRKKSSVLTYNDDAVFKAIENLRKFSKRRNKPSPKPTRDSVETDNQIPEVVYADDGRIFFPCYFCCNAFAIKNEQLAHMQTCTFRPMPDFSAPPHQQILVAKKVKKIVAKPRSFANKINMQNSVTAARKIQRNVLKPGIGKSAPSIQNTRTGASKPVSKKVAISKVQLDMKSGALVNIVGNKMNAMVARPKAVKSKALKSNTKQLVQSFNRGLNNNGQKPRKTSKKAQPKTAFPKIKLEEPLREHSRKRKKSKSPNRVSINAEGSFVEIKQEKSASERIRVSADQLKMYDQLYKTSDMTKCTLCYKPVIKIRWTRHLLTHAEERKYACKVCKKGFGRSDHRDVHERKHILSLINEHSS